MVLSLFPQVVSTKKSDGRTYRYLHIVESYREGKSVKKRSVFHPSLAFRLHPLKIS
jgi:hypothetical protein